MGVDTKSQSFEIMEPDYEELSIIRQGERAVKASGERLLPALGGQTPDEYEKYKDRGSFYNALKKTIQAMVGSLLRKDPIVEVPADMEDMLDRITVDNKGFDELARTVSDGVVTFGRIGLLVDKDDQADSEPYVAVYSALNIINWRTEIIDGQEKLVLLVLREQVAVADPTDIYEVETVWQYRVFRLINEYMDDQGQLVELAEPILEVAIYRDSDDTGTGIVQYGDTMYPEILGAPLDFIPFEFIGSLDNTPEPNEPPLLDVANLNIAHWKFSVDLAHGLHYTALPTPWAVGFNTDQELYVGGTKAWVTEEPGGSCGYLEFTGSGLKAIESYLNKLETQMATLGAQLLQDRRTGVEAAETARIRQTSETVTLITISKSISDGLTKTLQMVEMWRGSEPSEDTSVTMNTDFIETKITPQEITALLQTLLAGKISLDTFLYNLKEGEMFPPDREIDDEKKLIVADDESNFEREQEGLEAAAERVARYQEPTPTNAPPASAGVGEE